jgi:hypothetical protein
VSAKSNGNTNPTRQRGSLRTRRHSPARYQRASVGHHTERSSYSLAIRVNVRCPTDTRRRSFVPPPRVSKSNPGLACLAGTAPNRVHHRATTSRKLSMSGNTRAVPAWRARTLGQSVYRERDSSRVDLEVTGLLEASFENAFLALKPVCTLAHDSLLWCTLLVQLRTPLAGARLIH